MLKKTMICFSAGCIGAVANSIVAWWLGDLGITAKLGITMAPALAPAWLYPRIVWGGIWGLLFLLPMLSSKPMLKGSILSLFPTIVQLFVVFPRVHRGVGGIELGLLTPLLVLFCNWIWGVVTAMTIRTSR